MSGIKGTCYHAILHSSLIALINERPSPAGIKSRMQLSRDFLKRKLDEYASKDR